MRRNWLQLGAGDAQTGSLLGVQVRGYQVGDEGSIIRIERRGRNLGASLELNWLELELLI